MKKRILAFLMCLCLCASLLPMAALADETVETYNVYLTVNYPVDYTGLKVGGINIYDENGAYLGEYNESTVIKVPVGEMLIVRPIEMKDLSLVRECFNCGDMEIDGELFMSFEDHGSLTLHYIVDDGVDSGDDKGKGDDNDDKFEDGGISEGESIVGLNPATEDFEIRISMNYPEGYEGPAGGFYRVDESYEPYGDMLTHGDVVQVKAGELPTLRIVDIEGLGTQVTSNGVWRPKHDDEYSYVQISGSREAEYATLEIIYTSGDVVGGGPGEGEGGEEPAAGPYTVSFQVNYPGDYEGEPVGGIRVYDFDVVPGPGVDLSGLETADYTDYISLEEPIAMESGEVFWYSVIPLVGYESISDYNDGDAFNNCTNGDYRAFIANCGAEMLIMVTYGHNLGGDDAPMGPQPAAADFNVILDINLPDDYTGDGAVVTRKTRENGDGAVVDFGDNMTYGDGDIIAVKAGEWALFGYEELAGYIGNWHSNGTMYDGLIAVVDAPEDGSDYTLVLDYVTVDGITLNFAGSVGIQPGSRFGAGTLEEHAFAVMVDGVAVTNFTVTSADESVCTVKNDNGTAVVTNVGYGESLLTITVDGETAEFTWVCVNGDASGEPEGGTSEPFTVSLTVNYEDSYTGERVGGLGVYDENGNLLKIYNESAVIDVAAGEILITKAIEIENANMSSGWENCGARFIDGVEYVAFHENGSVEISYGGPSGGEGPVGPQPAAADFNVILDINLPDDYTGDGAVVTRKTRENGDGAVVDFGDNMTYGDGDTIAVKAGEWALFGYEEITGYTGNWHSNGTMYEGLIAVVDAPEDGSDYTLVLDYVSLKGLTVNFAGDSGIKPGSGFGAGNLGEHHFTVLMDGVPVTNFTVTSADESVCTVRNDNGTVIVTNVGYGESTLTITVDGASYEFIWACLNDGGSGEPGGPAGEPGVTVGPHGDVLPNTHEVLNREDTLVTDLTEDGSGKAILITSSAESGENVTIFVHTDDGQTIQDAMADPDVTLSVGFGFVHTGEGELSAEDKAAMEQVKKDVEPGKARGVVAYIDLTATLDAAHTDGSVTILGTVKELSEEAPFTMQVRKADLEAMGRDIQHLSIVRVHDGVAETIWEYREGVENFELVDGTYTLFFTTDRFSTYALVYDWVVGDIDGDDKPAELADVVRMMKFIAGEDVAVVPDSVDVNHDGAKDILDVIRLMRVIAGDDVSLS